MPRTGHRQHNVKDSWAWDLDDRPQTCRLCGIKTQTFYAHVMRRHKIQWFDYLRPPTHSSDVDIGMMPKRIRRIFGLVFD